MNLNFSQKIIDLEVLLHSFFDFARELYKETNFMKQKLLEIEMVDITDEKLFSFFTDVNKSMISLNFLHLPYRSRYMIKMKENSGVMNISKLFDNDNHGYENNEIYKKFAILADIIEPYHFYILSKKKENIMEVYKVNHLKKKLEVIILEESYKNQKNDYIFVIIAEVSIEFEFKKTLDFIKIWSIFNCDMNIILKNFPKKHLKTLLTLEFPLLIKEIIKLFQIQTIFSLYSDNDCFLMNILEEQKFDFAGNIYVNTLQFFNPLNIDESLNVFTKLFSIEKKPIKQKKLINFEGPTANYEFKVDILMGTNSKIKETMFFFGFLNRNVIFELDKKQKKCDEVENFMNNVFLEILESLDMKNYGYVSFFSHNEGLQTNFFKKLLLKELTQYKKTKTYSVFLVLNISFDVYKLKELFYFNFLENRQFLEKLETFLIFSIKKNIYETFDCYKKENEYQLLMTTKERKFLDTFNKDIPRIAYFLQNITQTMQTEFGEDLEFDDILTCESNQISKKLWGKILFEN